MKLLNSPFSLLPSQFLGMRSLIRYALDSVDFADTLWSAARMLPIMSILLLIVSLISALSCWITSATTCLNWCGNVTKSAGVTMSAQGSAVAADSAAAAPGVVLLTGVARMRTVASLTDAPLPCLMQLYFLGNLEPTRVRWKERV